MKDVAPLESVVVPGRTGKSKSGGRQGLNGLRRRPDPRTLRGWNSTDAILSFSLLLFSL